MKWGEQYPAKRDLSSLRLLGTVGEPINPKAWAADLPKTRSGKIMRRLLRDIADGRELGDVSTLGDPSVVATLQKTAADAKQR